MKRFIFYFFITVGYLALSQTIFLIDKQDFNIFSSPNLYYYEDVSENLSFEEINKNNEKYFKNGQPQHYNLTKPHWFLLKYKLKPNCINEHLLFELFDFKFQKGEIYFPQANLSYKKYDFGNLQKFETKEIYHKNFLWDMSINDTLEHHIYFKIQSNIDSKITGAIRTDNNFISWALDEYFYLALFYGVALSLLLYNLFIYLNLKDTTYLYYSAYIILSILWSLSNDGLGFQYLWKNVPFINIYIHPISTIIMITFLALYCRIYLNLSVKNPILDKILQVLLVIRTIPYLLWIFHVFNFNNISPNFFIIDLFVILYLLVLGFTSKVKDRSNYVIAFAFLVLGYLVYFIYYTGNYGPSLFGYYAINIGIALNMLVLALALITRLKTLILKTTAINNQLLQNLKEKELLQEDQNKQLEVLVKQRTQEYIEKNEELNSFIYRASHDIKGPISSLIGLAKISQIEDNPLMLKEYFKHVLTSSEKLDKTLSDLLQLSHVNESILVHDTSTIQNLVDEVLILKKYNENFKSVSVIVEVVNDIIRIDHRLIKPIIQNLVENSLKYYDHEKPDPWVKLEVYIKQSNLIIKVSDNGQGIQEQYREKIFDKFFRVGLKGSGSGLGLHIVKRCVEKLDGNIEMSSKIKEGTYFKIKIPTQSI